MKKYPYGIIVLVSVFLLLPSNTYGKTKKSDVVKSIVNRLRHMKKLPSRYGHGLKWVIRSTKVLSFCKIL